MTTARGPRRERTTTWEDPSISAGPGRPGDRARAAPGGPGRAAARRRRSPPPWASTSTTSRRAAWCSPWSRPSTTTTRSGPCTAASSRRCSTRPTGCAVHSDAARGRRLHQPRPEREVPARHEREHRPGHLRGPGRAAAVVGWRSPRRRSPTRTGGCWPPRPAPACCSSCPGYLPGPGRRSAAAAGGGAPRTRWSATCSAELSSVDPGSRVATDRPLHPRRPHPRRVAALPAGRPTAGTVGEHRLLHRLAQRQRVGEVDPGRVGLAGPADHVVAQAAHQRGRRPVRRRRHQPGGQRHRRHRRDERRHLHARTGRRPRRTAPAGRGS